MAANEKIYTDITQAKMDGLKSQLRSAGFTPPNGDHAIIQGSGVEIDADYSAKDGTLKLIIRKTPPLVSYRYVFNKIDQFMQRADAASGHPSVTH